MTKPAIAPCLFVMFGGTGDLMQRKILPTLYQLASAGMLNGKFHILGIARDQSMNDARFRDWGRKALAGTKGKTARQLREWCETCLHFEAVNQADPAAYERLAMRIFTLERATGLPGNRVFYLALPPGAFPGTIEALGKAGLNSSTGWTRLVIEKPFGRDLASARDLNKLVHQYFDESQVYRIDHYLGKETVQNLLAFRFGNALFESLWNRDHIKSVQITVAEALGVEDRAGYYENAGALRDMVQNHLTQLLTITAMEAPAAFEADSIRFEKVKVLRSIAPIADDSIVFGQYSASRDKTLPGYKQEPGVSPRSQTETFVALRLEIENWRWQGVPFYLRTGKRMARRVTEIAIHFRKPPIALFRSLNGDNPHTNALVITLQPDEGFELSFEVKSPGDGFSLQTQRMAFRYAEVFGTLPDGYETLLMDVIEGDQTLFVHADETEASWKLYAPLLEKRPKAHPYAAGSCGPKAADELGAACGTDWRVI
jgi:glucose-6-phosphate 1-dehydrogenase